MERQAEKLEQLLSQLPPAGIADFDRILMTLRDEAYT